MFWFGFGGGNGGATERIWVQIAAVMGVMRRHFPQLPGNESVSESVTKGKREGW